MLLIIVLLAELVDIQTVAPRIRLDIRYATTNNFTGKKVYDKAECRLMEPAARALAAAQQELEKRGLGLKVYDCYRPPEVQKKFWELVPDERYVANPAKGSKHNLGTAVDLTLVDRRGRELEMPTPYDEFTERAHRDYTRLPAAAVRNRAQLEEVMVRHGFLPLPTEWWHFDYAPKDKM